MTDKLVTLASYSDPIQARMVSQRLEAVGIPTYVNGDTSAGLLGGFNASIATVKLDVAESDVERAREVLDVPPPAESAAPEPADEMEPEEDLNSSEALAERAWRAALLGLITLPGLVHLFSLWLAFKVAGRDDTLSDNGTTKLYGALAIDGVALVGMALIVRFLIAG